MKKKTDLELLRNLYEISKTSDCHFNLTEEEYEIIELVEKRLNIKD
jgi:hypothetical protein